jgi:hypothetical protein
MHENPAPGKVMALRFYSSEILHHNAFRVSVFFKTPFAPIICPSRFQSIQKLFCHFSSAISGSVAQYFRYMLALMLDTCAHRGTQISSIPSWPAPTMAGAGAVGPGAVGSGGCAISEASLLRLDKLPPLVDHLQCVVHAAPDDGKTHLDVLRAADGLRAPMVAAHDARCLQPGKPHEVRHN